MQLSSLIGKPVLSPSGEAYGYITDVRLTRGFEKLACLVCADPEEEEFYLHPRAILSASDAVIAGRMRISSPVGTPSPIGKLAYNHSGDALGTVTDVIVSEEEETMLVITQDDADTMAPVSCASVAESVILYPDAESKRTATGPVRKPSSSPQKKRTPKPRASSNEEPAPETDADDASATPAEGSILLNRTNLLGRYVRHSVYDATGAPIALVGEQITPAILSTARRAGRLLELTVNTLTKY